MANRVGRGWLFAARGLAWTRVVAVGVTMMVTAVASHAVEGLSPPPLDQQIQALIAEKESRTATEEKIDSQLLLLMNPQKFTMVPYLRNRLSNEANPYLTVRIEPVLGLGAGVLRTALAALGLPIEFLGDPGDPTVLIQVLLLDLAKVAALPTVKFIRPEYEPDHHLKNTSEGDQTHAAEAARSQYVTTGAGQRVCVISDGIDSAAFRVQSGDLPPAASIYLLPNQTGSGDEGTAMLEIIYDLAPGASLGFATSNGGEAQFARNILDLADPAKGNCNIIVDDTDYLTESPFQDGVIATAVNTVTEKGVLYVSSAGNSGNLESGLSGTWEGDFNGASNLKLPSNANYVMHEWVPTVTRNPATSCSKRMYMHWAEAMGKSGVDYDIYILDSTGNNVVAFSNNIQSGANSPFEYTEAGSTCATGGGFQPGSKIVVVKPVGAEDRMFNLQWYRGTLNYGTTGATRGHSAAASSISVGATPALRDQNNNPVGPWPNPFGSSAKVEWFSSDGPRRIFFDVNGTVLPGALPGFKSNGGVVRRKPEVVAADGVKTNTPAFLTFYGTSAAAPHVAAIAALVWQANPGMNVTQLRQKLIQSTIPMTNNSEKVRGSGVLMASLALQPNVLAGPLDVDGNGKYDALTDGVLILRWLFGLTGTQLINGAIGPGAQRTVPADISAYLDGQKASLDVDNNAKTDALTDGLMILRYLFGLRGAPLIAGALGTGAQRTTAATIEPYIASLMP